MRKELAGLEFDSDFDSGNLATIDLDDDDNSDGGDVLSFVSTTARDCADTEFETGNRTWFYFAVRQAKPGQRISITIRDLNRQGKLFNQGHAPVVRVKQPDGKVGKWHRGCESIDHDTDEDEIFSITFGYKFGPCTSDATATYFAFCIPFGYDELQTKLDACDQLYLKTKIEPPVSMEPQGEAQASSSIPDGSSPLESVDDIYYHRELLVNTLDGLRVDLVTISACNGISDDEEQRLPGLFPDSKCPRAKFFPNKKVVFMSSRVHPGETPAAHVFNGFFDFILRNDDPRAKALRQMYVFKLVPMLNPDGVKRGHYRTDSRGQNLNRFYDKPSLSRHPAIFAVRNLLLHAHEQGTLLYYLDQHAHAAKRGVFAYGNALEMSRQIDNVTYARLVALNSQHFDFKGSCFSEGNMFAKDKRDAGLSKEGSGRVGMFFATNLTHCYTIEANYNTGKVVNSLPPACGEGSESVEKTVMSSVPPAYTTEIYEDVGRAFALAMLDMTERNPWSRVPNSEFGSLSALKKHIGECIRSSRMKQGKPPSAMPRRVAVMLRQVQAIRNLTKPPTRDGNNVSPKSSTATRPRTGSTPKLADRKPVEKQPRRKPPGDRPRTASRKRLDGASIRKKAAKPTSIASNSISSTKDSPRVGRISQAVSKPSPPRAKASATRVSLALNTTSISATTFNPVIQSRDEMYAVVDRLRQHSLTSQLRLRGADGAVVETMSRIPRPGSGKHGRRPAHFRTPVIPGKATVTQSVA